jgi:Holliday junction resolvase RusA-like endonuclease
MKFTVTGNPVPWERNDSRQGARFTAPRTREYEAHVAAAAHLAGAKPLEGPVRLTLRFYRATARRCDLDNLAKSVQDALNGVAYLDDSQIEHLEASKAIDRERPRVEVEVVPGAGEQILAVLNAVLGPSCASDGTDLGRDTCDCPEHVAAQRPNRKRLVSSVRRPT